MCLTHRYYDPGTGKFINRDPIGYAGGANLYGFADGNPVNEEDEDGLNPAGDSILKIAKTMAKSTRWGDRSATNPTGTGTGCSGFVFYCATHAGFRPHIKKPSYAGKVVPTADDWAKGNVVGWSIVPNNQAQAGDIIGLHP